MSEPKRVEVELIYLIEDGVYLVENLPFGYRFEIGGMTPKLPAVLQHPALLTYQPPARKTITHYVDAEGGRLTVEQYTHTRTVLLSRQDEHGEFDNLDDEFAWRKFQQRWTPVVVEEPSEPVSPAFKIVEIRRESGDPDITSLWNEASVPAQRCLYKMSKLAVSVKALGAACTRLGLGWERPEHSGVRFAKVEGAYVYDETMDFTRTPPFIGTLESCKKVKQELVERVEAPLLAAAAKKRGLLATPGSLGELRQLATAARSTAASLHLKTSSTSRMGVITPLDKLIQMLDAQIKEQVA